MAAVFNWKCAFMLQMKFAKLSRIYHCVACEWIMTNKTKLCAFTAYAMITLLISQSCAACWWMWQRHKINAHFWKFFLLLGESNLVSKTFQQTKDLCVLCITLFPVQGNQSNKSLPAVYFCKDNFSLQNFDFNFISYSPCDAVSQIPSPSLICFLFLC